MNFSKPHQKSGKKLWRDGTSVTHFYRAYEKQLCMANQWQVTEAQKNVVTPPPPIPCMHQLDAPFQDNSNSGLGFLLTSWFISKSISNSSVVDGRSNRIYHNLTAFTKDWGVITASQMYKQMVVYCASVEAVCTSISVMKRFIRARNIGKYSKYKYTYEHLVLQKSLSDCTGLSIALVTIGPPLTTCVQMPTFERN